MRPHGSVKLLAHMRRVSGFGDARASICARLLMQRLKNERGNILISFTELVKSTYRLIIIAQDNTAKILGFVGREFVAFHQFIESSRQGLNGQPSAPFMGFDLQFHAPVACCEVQ